MNLTQHFSSYKVQLRPSTYGYFLRKWFSENNSELEETDNASLVVWLVEEGYQVVPGKKKVNSELDMQFLNCQKTIDLVSNQIIVFLLIHAQFIKKSGSLI